MSKYCQVPLSPRGLQAPDKGGLQPKVAPGHYLQKGQHVRSVRILSQDLPWFSMVTTWSSGAHSKWFTQPCACELTPCPHQWSAVASVMPHFTERETEVLSSNDQEVNDLDMSRPGQKHRSSNSSSTLFLPNHA